MPSLMRFVTLLGTLAALGLASLYALATFVSPNTREITVNIPAQRLKPQVVDAAAKNPKTAGAEGGAARSATP